MGEDTGSEILATAQPTAARRGLAFVALMGMGAGVIYIALTQPAPAVAKMMLLGLGAVGLWAAEGLRRATSGRVELTRAVLRDGDGTLIAEVADITHVERGVFAFKPSNGFLVRTKDAHPRGWRMGLWWRVGRRVGIGGMMPVRQTKLMAEQLAKLVDEKRDPAG